MVRDIVRFLYSTTQERYRRLGWSFYRGNKVRDGLVRDKRIRIKALKRPDGMVKLFELTEGGKKEAERLGLKVQRTWRKGGLEHGYWVQEMARVLRGQGYAVAVEKGLGKGRCVDLEARRAGRRTAIEVETGKSDAASNIRKDMEAAYDRILVVCLAPGLRERIREQMQVLRVDGGDRVVLLELKDALNPDILEQAAA